MALWFLLPFSQMCWVFLFHPPSKTMPFPSSLFSLSLSVFSFFVLIFSPNQMIPLFCSLGKLSSYAVCSFSKSLSGIFWYMSLAPRVLTLQTIEIDSYGFKQKNNLLKRCCLSPSIPGKAGKPGWKTGKIVERFHTWDSGQNYSAKLKW